MKKIIYRDSMPIFKKEADNVLMLSVSFCFFLGCWPPSLADNRPQNTKKRGDEDVTYREAMTEAWYAYRSGYGNISPHNRCNGISNMIRVIGFWADDGQCPRPLAAIVIIAMVCRVITGTVPDRPPIV